MPALERNALEPGRPVVVATGEETLFQPGDRVRVLTRRPVGHYRVPTYLRGKRGRVVSVLEPRQLNNEEEGFGRNAGGRRHYYRIRLCMNDVWASYAGPGRDSLLIEVFESWLASAEA